MDLLRLKEDVDNAVGFAINRGEDPKDITVAVLVDINKTSVWASDVRLMYNSNGCASSFCVIVGKGK